MGLCVTPLALIVVFISLSCGQETWSLSFAQDDAVEGCSGSKRHQAVGTCIAEVCFDTHFEAFISSPEVGHFCEYSVRTNSPAIDITD
jgi:hypothetical protein